jgi:hypothetical protein
MNRIWQLSPHMGGKEMNYVNDAFDTNWVAPLGSKFVGFEEELSKLWKSDLSFNGIRIITGVVEKHQYSYIKFTLCNDAF